MERLTSNKPTPDMNMFELAHNSCYADEKRNARYRDCELDIDSRELVRSLVKDMCNEDLSDMSDEEFDEYMAEMLSVEMDSQIGLLALFYRNLWAMADLREKLKDYEDLEEQGRLIKLPCKEAYTESGDIVYLIYDDEMIECTHCGLSINPVDGKAYIALATDEDIFPYRRPIPEYDLDPTDWCTNTIDAEVGEIGKTVFLTKVEAEVKLKELRGKE
jgi:hypothetical protein